MKTEERRACPSCGNEFSGAMEFCPVCMLRNALAGGVESGESSAQDAVVATSEQVTQRFEHYELMSGTRRETGRVGSRCDGRHIQSVRRRSALPRDSKGDQREACR